MPAQEFPKVDVQFADKWAHWVMYAFLFLAISAERIIRKRTTHFPCFILIAILVSIYGGLMELGQAYLTSTRHGDWLDVAANTFGAFCGLACLTLYIRFFKK
jgi:VanZ family protein